MRPFSDPSFIYGSGYGDDAGVFKIAGGMALVQTVDFFTPIVDDPYKYGRIAGANSLSDVYALGGKPLTALNILSVSCSIGHDVIGEILNGGGDAVREAGAVIVGGHSVSDNEPKYGLAVTGIVNPEKMVTSRSARPGDALILTKKIGTGILTSALKARNTFSSASSEMPQKVFTEAENSMMRLNKDASETMLEFSATACTDITGFGLLGHAGNIAEASGVKLVINYSAVPRFEWIENIAMVGTKGGGERNYNWLKPRIDVGEKVTRENIMILCDAQTSGGLLIAAPPEKAEAMVRRLRERGDEPAAVIGHVEEGEAGIVAVRA